MPIADVIQEIDKEIERLSAAKNLLTGNNGSSTPRKQRAHTLSAAARKRISLAQKARWAAAKKQK